MSNGRVDAGFFLNGFCAELPLVAVSNYMANAGYSVRGVYAATVAADSTYLFRAFGPYLSADPFVFCVIGTVAWFGVQAQPFAGLVVAAAALGCHLTAVEGEMIKARSDSGRSPRAQSFGRIVGAVLSALILYRPNREIEVFLAQSAALTVGAVAYKLPTPPRLEGVAAGDSLPIMVDEGRLRALRSGICCFLCYCAPHYGTVAFFFLRGPLRFSLFEVSAIDAINAVAYLVGAFAGPGWPELNVLIWATSTLVATTTLTNF